MNSINRAMGRPDLYPFVLTPAVVEKLGFVHDLMRGAAASAKPQFSSSASTGSGKTPTPSSMSALASAALACPRTARSGASP